LCQSNRTPPSADRTGRSDAARKRMESAAALKAAVLAGASIVVALGGMEAFLRLVPSFQVQKEPQQIFCTAEHRRNMPHADYGYSEVPGNVYFEKTSPVDDWYFVKINKDGFRDNYDSGAQQVIVLGDSFVRGSLVDESQQFGYLLDLWHPDIAFRNYGIGGFGQAEELRLRRNRFQSRGVDEFDTQSNPRGRANPAVAPSPVVHQQSTRTTWGNRPHSFPDDYWVA
jgi:hypothetical protein